MRVVTASALCLVLLVAGCSAKPQAPKPANVRETTPAVSAERAGVRTTLELPVHPTPLGTPHPAALLIDNNSTRAILMAAHPFLTVTDSSGHQVDDWWQRSFGQVRFGVAPTISISAGSRQKWQLDFVLPRPGIYRITAGVAPDSGDLHVSRIPTVSIAFNNTVNSVP